MQKINAKTLLKGDSLIASSEKNDCTVYAVATAFGLDYDSAYKEVTERMGREQGKGASGTKIKQALKEGTTLNGKTVTRVIDTPRKTYKVYGNTIPRQVRLSSFVKENPEGTYLILTRSHALTLKDGVIVDSLNNTKTKALISVAFKVE